MEEHLGLGMSSLIKPTLEISEHIIHCKQQKRIESRPSILFVFLRIAFLKLHHKTNRWGYLWVVVRQNKRNSICPIARQRKSVRRGKS